MSAALAIPTAHFAAPALDARVRIPERCTTLGITREFLAVYVGISKGEMSKRIQSGFTGPQTLALDEALNDIEWMLEHFHPLRPPMTPETAWRVKNFIRACREMQSLTHKEIREVWESVAA